MQQGLIGTSPAQVLTIPVSPVAQMYLCLQDLADARVSLTGHAEAMPQQREDAVKLLYKSKNPESFWADFGDFKPFYMEEVVAVHFNGGFGRAGRKVRSAQPAVCVMPHLCPSLHPLPPCMS